MQDKVALITGASRGIGEAIARAYADQGAIVWITDINEESGEALARAIGERARFRHLDVREESDWTRVMDELLERDKRLDVLVNNAGITGFEGGVFPHDPEHATLENWHAVHRTNLDGVFLGCKYAIRAMRGQGSGAIINISSRSGQVGIPGAAAYASSKAAVRNHTKTVALYCAEHGLGVRCNSIHPAAVLTPMWEPLLGDGPERDARMRDFVSDTPLQRFGRPEEVAQVAVMLGSDEVPYMTGSELTVDGGVQAGTVDIPALKD